VKLCIYIPPSQTLPPHRGKGRGRGFLRLLEFA